MRPAASPAGSRKVPVHTSPCQSENTMVESPACAETPMRRTEPLVSKNQVRSPNKWPSTGTRRLWHRRRFLATGTPGPWCCPSSLRIRLAASGAVLESLRDGAGHDSDEGPERRPQARFDLRMSRPDVHLDDVVLDPLRHTDDSRDDERPVGTLPHFRLHDRLRRFTQSRQRVGTLRGAEALRQTDEC